MPLDRTHGSALQTSSRGNQWYLLSALLACDAIGY
jgi:hypothetical protein